MPASFYPFILSLADKTTGVPATGYTQLNLRASPYSTATYSQVSASGGSYTFGTVGTPVESGEYKLYDNTTELTAFGIIKVGESGAVLNTGNETVAGNKNFTGTTTLANSILGTGAISVTGDMTFASGKALYVDKTPVTGNEVMRLEDMTSYMALSGGNEIADTQLFTGEVGFEIVPTCALSPADDSDLTNKLYVDEQVSALEVTPYQQSGNEVRCYPSGTQETSKVYTTWTSAMSFAAEYASSARRYIIDIPGGGELTNVISVNADFEDYISVKGGNQLVKLDIGDTTYSVTAGTVIVENVTIMTTQDTAATPQFTNFIFKDVYFDLDVQAITFSNCTFRGNCYVKNAGTTITFTNCKGGYVATNGAISATMFGIDGLSTSDF